jgi:hypothetical protein
MVLTTINLSFPEKCIHGILQFPPFILVDTIADLLAFNLPLNKPDLFQFFQVL